MVTLPGDSPDLLLPLRSHREGNSEKENKACRSATIDHDSRFEETHEKSELDEARSLCQSCVCGISGGSFGIGYAVW